MALISILKPDFAFADDRGLLVQIAHGSVSQVNAVFTKKGAVRGNLHYHKLNEEIFFVISGKIRVIVYADVPDAVEEYFFTGGDMFMIPPYVRHTFEYLDDTYLTVLYSSGVELPDGSKDIYND